MRVGVRNGIVCIGGIVFIIPIVFTFVFSFINDGVTVEPWQELLLNCFIFYNSFWNSCLYSIVITILHVVLVVPCAFGLHILKGRLSKNIIFVCTILAMMPLQVTILPNYIGLRDMNLLNTRAAIILPMVFSTFGIVVIYEYMKNFDWDQIEAARIETSSPIQIICRIVLPNIKYTIVAVAVYIFIDSYNMLEQPLLFLEDQSKQNLTVLLSRTSEFSANVFLPMAVIFMLPPILGGVYMAGKMMENKCLDKCIKVVGILFFSSILFLTIFSRDIHYNNLVRVKTIEPELKSFQIDENTVGRYYAMPYQFSNYKTYYVTEKRVINGEERTCLRQTYIKLGNAKKGYCPILNNDYSGEPIVVRVTGKIHDNDEVIELR